MRIGKDNVPLHSYCMENHNLKYSTCEKDIGVFIDSKLNFDVHIANKVNRANKIMGVIRRTFDYIDEDMFKIVFKSLVRPHIEYANQVWAPHTKKQINTIENVQRRATKLVPGRYELNYEERLRKLDLPSLSYRRLRGDIIELYKIVHPEKGYDRTIPHFIPLATNSLRGHPLKIYIRRPRLDIRKYSFCYRSARIWNSLPESIVMAPNLHLLEKRLDKYWADQPIKYQYEEEYEEKQMYREDGYDDVAVEDDDQDEY